MRQWPTVCTAVGIRSQETDTVVPSALLGAAFGWKPLSKIRAIPGRSFLTVRQGDVTARPVQARDELVQRSAPGSRAMTECSQSSSQLVESDAAFRIGDHRAISVLTKRVKLAGVLSCLAGIDPPRSARRFFTNGSSSALSNALDSFVTISLGVPFGAKIPAQMLI